MEGASYSTFHWGCLLIMKHKYTTLPLTLTNYSLLYVPNYTQRDITFQHLSLSSGPKKARLMLLILKLK